MHPRIHLFLSSHFIDEKPEAHINYMVMSRERKSTAVGTPLQLLHSLLPRDSSDHFLTVMSAMLISWHVPTINLITSVFS